MNKEILRAGQVARELGCHRNTIRRWALVGRFPGAWFDGKEWRIPRSAMESQHEPIEGSPDDYPGAQITVSDYADLLSGLDNGSVDLVLTDPPYTISKDTGFKNIGANSVKRFAVDMDFGEWDKSLIDLSNLARLTYAALRRGGTAIIWYDLWKLSYLSEAMLEAGFKQLRLIVWEKSNPVPLNQSINYLTNSREVAVLGVKVGTPTFNAKYHSGVFRQPIPRDGGKRLHPTQKPLRLFNELVQTHSSPNDLVVDPFLGSGTSAVAAVGNGRNFIGSDINSEYVKVSIERLHKEVPKS